MKEMPERSLAKPIVFLCVQYKFVPKVINDLGRHPNQAISRASTHQKELSQSSRYQELVFLGHMTVVLVE